MPELPEVQTIISDLNKKIIGDTITDFWSDWPKAIKSVNGGKSASSADKFKKEIIGRKILGARRIGKNIFIDLDDGPLHTGRGKKTLYIHLKMTGHLLVKSRANFQFPISPAEPGSRQGGDNFQSISNDQISKSKKRDYFNDKVNQYIHHAWILKTKNKKLKTMEFSDVRKFAKIVLDDTEKIKELPEIKKLGVDALDKKFTLEKFEEILENNKNKPVGIILMEQEKISGIGNIYRSEILFEAGILPARLIKNIKGLEIKKLYAAIQRILEKAIKLRGTSDSDYRDTSGAPGKFQKALKVYRRDGKRCLKCGTITVRSKMGQRSIFFCPVCQK